MVYLYFKKPLDKKTEALLIEEFDNNNYGYHSKKPSYKDNVTIEKNGTYCLDGMDNEEGKLTTHLYFSKDRKSIDVDSEWNLGEIKRVLKQRKVLFSPKTKGRSLDEISDAEMEKDFKKDQKGMDEYYEKLKHAPSYETKHDRDYRLRELRRYEKEHAENQKLFKDMDKSFRDFNRKKSK